LSGKTLPSSMKPGESKDGASWSNKGGAVTNRSEEFPSLPGSAPVSNPSVTSTYARTFPGPKVVKNENQGRKVVKSEDFPGLPSSRKEQNTPQKSKESAKPKGKAADFPGLPVRKAPSEVPSRPSVKPVMEEFPGLPAKRALKQTNSVVSRPASAPSRATVTVKPKSVEPPTKPKKPPGFGIEPHDEDEHLYSRNDPDLDLSAFSKLTVKNSGQDLSFTSSKVGSNIKTVDKSVLDSINAANVKSNSKADLGGENFPGLGAPEKKLNLSEGSSKAKKNKKNVVKSPGSKPFSMAAAASEKPSLSGICDFLGGSDKKSNKPLPSEPTMSTNDKKQNKQNNKKTADDRKVKPVESKLKVDEVYRPSRQSKVQPSFSHEERVEVKVIEDGEDFPSLGGKTRGLGANFIKAEDKLIKKEESVSKWSTHESTSGKENLKQNKVLSVPPGFHAEKPKAKSRTPPGFSDKILSEHVRNFSQFKYTSPPNFQERNQKLISTIQNMIGGKSLEFKMFKDISGQFRSGSLSSDAYFTQCRDLVSKDKFNKFFPELVVLLPDIAKQVELLELVRKTGEPSGLTMCPTCGQVCLPADKQIHSESHRLDQDFPQL